MSHHTEQVVAPAAYGLMAEFPGEHELLVAAQRARAEGYTRMDAFSPVPVEGLSDVLGHRRSRVPLMVLCGGIIGGTTGFLLQYWTMAKAYPLNIGGKPLNSWPQWIPVTFEMTILFASLFAVVGMFLLNGLPLPYHPVFNVNSFARASQDAFFLCIEAKDPRFDPVGTRRFLESLHPIEVSDVAE